MWMDDARSVPIEALRPVARAEARVPVVVIGLGNSLMGDDGLGVAVVDRLRDEWRLPPGVALIDGGTLGLGLLPAIEQAERLLLIDAIDRGMPPGTEIVLDRGEIPLALTLKVSPHQVDLREALALAELRGTLPVATVAIGLQPERSELSTELSPPLERALDRIVDLALAQLELWGYHGVPQRRHARA